MLGWVNFKRPFGLKMGYFCTPANSLSTESVHRKLIVKSICYKKIMVDRPGGFWQNGSGVGGIALALNYVYYNDSSGITCMSSWFMPNTNM
jgi:hypothetical protein